MRDPSVYVNSLLELATVSGDARRTRFRQALVALARASAEPGPGPLEGLHPEALLRGVQAALSANLFDDLDWLSPPAAGVAVFALASALPPGPAQRELGRRVLARLLTGDAETFVAMASRMAQTAGRGLGAPTVRSRVSLVMELPISVGIPDGPLALALVTRREYAREWISTPSTRSLPARRLAARVLERAAREAARRAAGGDLFPMKTLMSEGIRPAWERLLGDRESLVWRHVAVARGLLLPWADTAAIEKAFTTNITEWRRAVTSATALIATSPDLGLKLAHSALRRGVLERDPGASQAFVWGLARAAEQEPDAAEGLLHEIIGLAGRELGEALTELRMDLGDMGFVERAAEAFLSRHPPLSADADDGAVALSHELARDLTRPPTSQEGGPLRHEVRRALAAWVTSGPRAAHALGEQVLEAAKGELAVLFDLTQEQEATSGGGLARRSALASLRDLDLSLLEHNVLLDLLRMGPKADHVRAQEEELDGLRERLGQWILDRERQAAREDTDGRRPPHPTIRLRRLRALLHAVDGDPGEGEGAPRTAHQRDRWQKVVGGLLVPFDAEPPAVLRRSLLATIARALDGLIRSGACDVADALLVLADRLSRASDFDVLSEASMDPDLCHVLAAYTRFLRISEPKIVLPEQGTSLFPASERMVGGIDRQLDRLKAFDALTEALAPQASIRSEALRTMFMRLSAALSVALRATSLSGLGSGSPDSDALVAVENGVFAILQMCAGARGRIVPGQTAPTLAPSRALSVAVARVVAGGDAALAEDVLSRCIDELLRDIPIAVARLLAGLLWSLLDLPVFDAVDIEIPMSLVERLPAWLPPRRTIGGFYVQRSLGAGGSGTVFVVVRADERHEPGAERLALKVPDYSATAAASLSEAEFLTLFRQEASALMGLPPHANLARFVSFDVASKPKPILVMELVEGTTLEHAIGTRTLDVPRCLGVLDGLLDGLAVMHGVGLGHLDLKPTNVVLRKESGAAVLVDFGLAGRHVRRGCCTGPYGSPEVWGAVPDAGPAPADVYAFACLAFEVLTGKVLFHGTNETAQIAAHLKHDGWTSELDAIVRVSRQPGLGKLFYGMLRRDPKERIDVREIKERLADLQPDLAALRWPLVAGPA